jgi:glycosyltransferase involved in cell wall biosynthesis
MMNVSEEEKRTIFYVYPRFKNISFSLIAKHHVSFLKQVTNVEEINEETLDIQYWLPHKTVLLHPILYSLIGDRKEQFEQRRKRLDKLLPVVDKIGGFDTADSDKISEVAVEVLNKMNLIFVPSNYAKESYVSSGVSVSVEVLPHGVSKAFLRKPRVPTNEHLRKLFDYKRRNNIVYILFFYMHSGWRKGVDIVLRTYENLIKHHKNVILIVKHGGGIDQYIRFMRYMRVIEVSEFLSEDDLVDLYDLADILLVPSRGGGFGLNALEGIARGCITIVPDYGCFKDYIKYTIPVFAPKPVEVFPDNPIHVGMGREVEYFSFYEAIASVLKDLKFYKTVFKDHSKKVRKAYSWEVIGNQLIEKLKHHGFL